MTLKKTWVHKHSFFLKKKNYSKEKQDDSIYIQGGRRSGRREKFRRGG
jgi:hypothetical protein